MSPHKDTKANLLLNFWGSAECTWKGNQSLLQVGLESWTFRFFVQWWSTCNPLLYTFFYLNLHYSTMALLHFIMVLLHFTLPWFYFTLLDSSSLYHWSTSLLFILPWLYLIVHHSIMALDHSSSLYHGFTGFYFTVCMFPEIIEVLHGIGHS